MILNIKLGSDPEFVVTKDNNPFPSTYLISGTKDKPEDYGDGFMVLKDNVLVEGNMPSASTKTDFIYNMKLLKDIIKTVLKSQDKSLNIECLNSAKYENRFLQHEEALQFGCSPYLNAYDGKKHVAPNLSNCNTRSCGFHIHISYITDLDHEICNRYIAKAMDLFLTIPSFLDSYDEFRVTNYGALGSYRNTKYGEAEGLEYRSLGGYFAREDKLSWVIDQTYKALYFVSENNLDILDEIPNELNLKHILPSISKLYNSLGLDLNKEVINKKILAHV